ncbi:MAG: DUF5312 domain-containing protein [Pirellulales bacterium]|nr:DUF5312 domain-containing protein [Pirellulales bacterium]
MPADNENVVFDRLVDGELSAHERRQLLATLDTQQDGWRRCALAFLEAQAWQRRFKQWRIDSEDEKVLPAAAEPQSPTVSRSLRWLALAACLLVAFALGRTFRPSDAAGPQKVHLAGTGPQENAEQDEAPVGPPENQDAVTLLVRDTSGKNRRLQVPLMDVVTLDKQFGQTLPAELRARFQQRGFDLERRRRYAPMFFEQNQQLVPMVVPVNDTYIVPVSRPVY